MGRVRQGRMRVPGVGGRPDREVGWLVRRPRGAHALLVLGHGAGAGMRHVFMDELSEALDRRGVASFRYQFPYMESGSRRPDPRVWLLSTVRAAVGEARRRVRGLPVFVGGKSMGGRMSSLAWSESPLAGASGLVFFGFPLHPPDRPGIERADHLRDVDAPMLFLQGQRDKLAEWRRIRGVVRRLGPKARLHGIPEADHGFHVPRRSGRTDAEVIEELAEQTAVFVGSRRRARRRG